MINHGLAKVKALRPRIDGILALAHANAHAAMRLLGDSVNKSLDYYLKITPPDLAAPAAGLFWRYIKEARAQILQLVDHDDPGTPATIQLHADMLAALPMSAGGFGHTTQIELSPCAFLASVKSTQHDSLLGTTRLQLALRPFCEHAYNLLQPMIDRPLDECPEVMKVFPPSATELTSGVQPSSTIRSKTTKKVQAALYSAVSATNRRRLRDIVLPSVGEADTHVIAKCVHIHLITARSQQSRMMVGSLWFDDNVIESEHFVHFTRYYMGLLPLLKPWCASIQSETWNGLQSVCAGGHESACLLQPDASHTIACPSSFGARHAAHERINRVFAKFIRKAGCEAIVNPSTRAMLGEHFDDAAARILFPRIPTEAAKKDAEVLKSAFHLAETTTGSAREAAQECIRRMAENCARKHEGLRVDCIAELSNSLLWIDVGIVHPTARSKLAQTLSFVRQHDIAEKAAMGSRCRHAFVGKPTPPVKSYQTLKEGKYQAMVDQASQQVAKGRRARAPVLTACIFSHLGELSPVAIKTVEIITMAYKAMVSKMLFEDGIPLKKRTAAFRMQFKDALMCANASGFGRTLSVTGRPRAGCRISSPDANGGFPDWEVLH